MYNALLSLYEDVKCCVKVFITTGLKQGGCLSPILFNLYINEVSNLGIGIYLLHKVVSIMLLAETETDLQILIDLLQVWCKEKKMKVNLDKTKVVYFRRPSTPKSNVLFQYDNKNIGLTNQVWHFLSEHLDYNAMGVINLLLNNGCLSLTTG